MATSSGFPPGRSQGTRLPPWGEANEVSFGGSSRAPPGRSQGKRLPPWGEANEVSFGGSSFAAGDIAWHGDAALDESHHAIGDHRNHDVDDRRRAERFEEIERVLAHF